MSRSIVRSKINAKYNAGGTGGGGGSAIAIYDEGSLITPAATSLNFTGGVITASGGPSVTVNVNLVTAITVAGLVTLRNAGTLVPGMIYQITDAPILGFVSSPVGFPKFYITALNSSEINSCGVLELPISFTPLILFENIELWYDINTNTHPRLYDSYRANLIEGWGNIANFCGTICGTIFYGSFNIGNTITNGSNIIFTSTPNTFKFNYISGATVSIADIYNFSGNYIENCNNFLVPTGAEVNLQASIINNFTNNYITYSKIIDEVGNLNNAGYDFTDNYIENSTIFFTKNYYGIFREFKNNTVKFSSIINSDTYGIEYFNFNYIEQSYINFYQYTYPVNYFNENSIVKSQISFWENAYISDLVSNTISNTELNIYAIYLEGPVTITDNTIQESAIQLVSCKLSYCNIFGMGSKNSMAVLDTDIFYEKCNYRLGEDSTFYVSYDIDNSDIPTVNTFVVPTGHETWVGKFIFYSSLGGGPYSLKTIANPVANHRYYIYMDGNFSRLDMDISTGFFVMPQSAAGLIQLQTQYDYMYVDGRPSPIGTQTGGENVVISYDYY